MPLAQNDARNERSIEPRLASIALEIHGLPADDFPIRQLSLNAADLSPEDQGALARILRQAVRRLPPPRDVFERLTAREGEISALVCEGLGNQAIAERLSISEATVRHHLTSIFAKLQVPDRVALVIAAFARRDASSES